MWIFFDVLPHGPPLPPPSCPKGLDSRQIIFFTIAYSTITTYKITEALAVSQKIGWRYPVFLAVLIFSRGRFQNQTFNRRYNRDILRLCDRSPSRPGRATPYHRFLRTQSSGLEGYRRRPVHISGDVLYSSCIINTYIIRGRRYPPDGSDRLRADAGHGTL